MKAIYTFLQSNAFGLCILFGTCPYLPAFFQKNVGDGFAAIYTLLLLAGSAFVFLLCILWLKSDWELEKKAYMVALSFGSALGSLIGFSALLGMHGVNLGTWFYLLWREVPATILIGCMLAAVFAQFMSKKKEPA